MSKVEIEKFKRKNGICFVVPNSKRFKSKNIGKLFDFANRKKLNYILVGMPTSDDIVDRGNSILISKESLEQFALSSEKTLKSLLDDDKDIFMYYPTNERKERISKQKKDAKNFNGLYIPENKKTITKDGKTYFLGKSLSWKERTQNDLNNNSTAFEDIVYKALLSKLGKFDILRQYYISIDKNQYFIDIYIPKIKVAIEVDGGYHKSEAQVKIDRERDANLSRAGIRTFRIRNENVVNSCRLNEFIDLVLM